MVEIPLNVTCCTEENYLIFVTFFKKKNCTFLLFKPKGQQMQADP